MHGCFPVSSGVAIQALFAGMNGLPVLMSFSVQPGLQYTMSWSEWWSFFICCLNGYIRSTGSETGSSRTFHSGACILSFFWVTSIQSIISKSLFGHVLNIFRLGYFILLCLFPFESRSHVFQANLELQGRLELTTLTPPEYGGHRHRPPYSVLRGAAARAQSFVLHWPGLTELQPQPLLKPLSFN